MARMRWLLMLGGMAFLAGYLSQDVRDKTVQGPEVDARGRFAAQPLAMTRLGWKDVLLRTYQEMNDDRLFSVAAGVAFYALMALVPALSAIVSLYGLLADPMTVQANLSSILVLMPQAARDIVNDQAVRLAAEPNARLSIQFVISILIALWGANAAIKALFDALNVIYDENEKRSLFKLNVISLGVTVSAIVLLVMMVFLIAILPNILRFLPSSPQLDLLITWLRWPFFYLIAVLAIAALYWVGPSRRPARFAWVIPGALASAALWAVVSAGFSWYAASMGNYQATYGSLAAVVVFMLWLWLSASVILLGAELNAELEHQTIRDTTIGHPKPLGLRGAYMADHVGPAVARKD